ncbi:serine hydrolase domain-containing protein [Microbacterium invictum]|uniref:Serine hydrolase domain-containing protein n=1 Tax=Microbacterium invictum TaxID=515415 RepID=A0ABZ0VEC3_9MICO|nr:serine hydrolase domain-containing protein [Microbacterium invictum]WQB71268.1 serine hydrolase domain-containing protein [Microbacterium invictum]
MNTTSDAGSLTRRTLLAGGGVIALTAVLASCFPAGPSQPSASASPSPSASPGGGGTAAPAAAELTDELIATFDAAVIQAFEDFGLVGAAVALFQGDEIVYNKGFGRRDLSTGESVTPNTRFRIGSNTKSMTSLLIAKYVDDGLVTWDTRIVDLWPDFVAPTPELTESLTLHRLLGMGSGLAEPETIEFFASGGGVDAEQLLRTIPYLEVISTTYDDTYAYNNTLVAAAPYLIMLADGTDPSELEERYARDIADLVFTPIGMDDAVFASDPRPYGGEFATGYQRDLEQNAERSPFVSIGGYGPAGMVMASSTDMARYLITQSKSGVAPDGTVVASAENVDRTHQPGVVVPPDAQNALPSLLLADTASTNYALGWFDEIFNDGQRMLWHAGGIDGFGSLMGFLPEEGIGFVALTNYEPNIGGLFNFSVQSSFLDMLFGLNADLPATLATVPATLRESQSEVVASTTAVDEGATEPFLGLYSDGFELARGGEELELRHDIRRMRLRATGPDEFVIMNGPSAVSGRSVALSTDAGGSRQMTIDGFPAVTWLSGD